MTVNPEVYSALISDGVVPITDSAAELAHTVDRYEKVVTADLRMLIYHRDLLTDALHALRNGSPHVTDEYIERTLSAMSGRIDAIRSR